MTRLALVLSLLAAAPALADDAAPLGKKDPGLYNLKGQIYFLQDGQDHYDDDYVKGKSEGTVYADHLDVPTRDFTQGFPGVTNRFEWFAILYTGTMQVTKPGDYTFALNSDDGSKLWIDGKLVVDDDGAHASTEVEGTVKLDKGMHQMKVWYFQGPATEIALQLFVTEPAGQKKILSMADYSSGVTDAVKGLNAEATPQGIKVQLDAAVLFDTDKFDLKPAAQKSLAQVAELLAAYPNARVEISGHTDSMGDEAYNQKLSENRAASVKTALAAVAGLPKTVTFETHGYGKSQPIADNATEKGRAKNRRVEILIHP